MVETAPTEHMFPVDLREQRRSLVLTASDTRPVVVVLGMHRSGTSLCSHVLSALGVEMTGVPTDLEIAPSNAKGHWERMELRELQDRVLERFNRSYYGPCHDLPLPAAWWADPEIRPVRDKMLAFMRERMPNRALFGFKDPRTARLLPLWRHIFHELGFTPKVVLCLRNPAQVARSLAARNGLDPGIGEYRWFVYMTEVFRHSHDWEICTIEYEDWFPEPMTNVRKLIRFLGLAWDDSDSDLSLTAAAVVDGRLRHQGIECGEAQQPLVRSLYRLARSFTDDAARDGIAQIVSQFAAYQQLQQPIHSEFERLSGLAAKLPEFERQAAELAATVTKLETELAVALHRSEELSATNEALRGTLVERTAQLAEAEQAASASSATAEAQIAALREEIRRSEALIAERESTLSRLQSERAALATAQSKSDLLQKQCETLEKTLADRDNKLAQADQQAAEQQRRIERLYAELSAVSDDLATRERALSDAIRLAEQLAVELRSAQAELAASDAVREDHDRIARQVENLARERDRLAAESARWFDAAILAMAEDVVGHRRSRHRLAWLPGRHAKQRIDPPMIVRADRARDERCWERAARFYLEALYRHPERPTIWIQLGHALKEAGKIAESEFAYRKATELAPDNFDAFFQLGALLKLLDRKAEAIAAYVRARDLAGRGEMRDMVTSELVVLGCADG
jgi:hypothetical protein